MTDAPGGDEVRLPVALKPQQFSIPAGKQQLTGEQALAFVRERKAFTDGDCQRVKNQEVFLKVILSRYLRAETLANPRPSSNWLTRFRCTSASTHRSTAERPRP
ncbi:LCP family protein [Pseudarthrobacter enclensis]|uniref:LCP family protein n=1 Tax=Pseudarthrobacter enclensis TaxID=993070 RepID=UPI003447A37C